MRRCSVCGKRFGASESLCNVPEGGFLHAVSDACIGLEIDDGVFGVKDARLYRYRIGRIRGVRVRFIGGAAAAARAECLHCCGEAKRDESFFYKIISLSEFPLWDIHCKMQFYYTEFSINCQVKRMIK